MIAWRAAEFCRRIFPEKKLTFKREPAWGGGQSEMAASILGTEFAFNGDDFDRVRTLLRQHTGISLSEAKRSMVYSRLARRLRVTGMSSFRDYLAVLKLNSPEWEQFVNALTTNLTYFYRESHHFQILADFLKQCSAPGRTQQVWCAAASTGEEAWTIALTAIEAFGSLTPPVRIVATDIDTQVLEVARQGIYRKEQISKIPEALVRRYFVAQNTELYRVRPEVQALVSFRQLNLLAASWPLQGPFDAIFCRNVLIYFDRVTQLKVVERMARLSRPGTRLFVGHSESFSQGQQAFELQGRTVYVRVDGRASHGR